MKWTLALIPVLTFALEVRTVHPVGDVTSVAVDPKGTVWAAGSNGLASFRSGTWTTHAPKAQLVAAGPQGVWYSADNTLFGQDGARICQLPPNTRHLSAYQSGILASTPSGLYLVVNGKTTKEFSGDIRQSAIGPSGKIAVAAAEGLFVRESKWDRVFPKDGNKSWAPVDVRGVAFDSAGRLWFAGPQGVGSFDGTIWHLYTPSDGLPYDDFTSVAAGEDGAVWFGTKIGAVRKDRKGWEYRQGPRWIPDDDVRSIAVTAGGDAWIATSKGLSQIERKQVTLADKASFFESEIDKRHRRTPYGYVLEVRLAKPGDTSQFTQHDSDNDGLWTSMYGAGECFAFGATGDPNARARAVKAFEALRFLGTVTQGGEHPAPRGFVARSILPVSGPDPNVHDSVERDRRTQQTRDKLWKVISPRWPKNGDWYWKSDTSSDELDGHYFFYGIYYDLVAKSEEEKRAVRDHVAALTDHLIDHNYQLVDHDGKVTRWGIFDPDNLNKNVEFWAERGMNSLSMLAYLKVAGHITGNERYEQAYRALVEKHSYDMNVLIGKTNAGPGSGNQSDDEMIFMNYYGLLRYEKDPALRNKYLLAFHNHWLMEEPELNPLFNYLYASIAGSEFFQDGFAKRPLAPKGSWKEDSLETLERFPMDRIEWPYRNSHRKDIVRLPDYARERREGAFGHRVNGKVLPIDERFVEHWNHDPWALDRGGNGSGLADGAAYLLPYYLGRYYKFVD